jgi:hypothetical protein
MSANVTVTANLSVRVDFWGAHVRVTFLLSTSRDKSDVKRAVSAMEGDSCSSGGDGEGVPTMDAHPISII